MLWDLWVFCWSKVCMFVWLFGFLNLKLIGKILINLVGVFCLMIFYVRGF